MSFQKTFTCPRHSRKKLNGAIKGIANNEVTPSKVLLVYDSTLFGGAGDGILLSKDTLYYKAIGDKPRIIILKNIKNVLYDKDVSVDKNGKETVKESVIISIGDDTWRIATEPGVKLEKLATWLLRLRDAAEQNDDETEQKVTVNCSLKPNRRDERPTL